MNCFKKISFNERLSGYGHEDTLFGYELNKNNIQIHHIDNPVLNGHLDTNEAFLLKTEEGLGLRLAGVPQVIYKCPTAGLQLSYRCGPQPFVYGL